MHVFVDQPLDDEAMMTKSLLRLRTLAQAWTTPGSRYHQSAYVRSFVLTAVRDVHAFVYHPDATKAGNWWEWEIGSSKAFADILAIFYDHIQATDLALYCSAIDYFVPDPWTQQNGIKSTGANRVDLCQSVVVRSLLTTDEARLRHAVEGLAETWTSVECGDGFYRDGSYVQHSTVPYTGTYGVVLLEGLSLLLALLSGSAYDIDASDRAELEEAVTRSYAPFIWRGQMMDAVRGRAISREEQNSFAYGDDAIEAMLRLAGIADPVRAECWRGLCKGWIEDARGASWNHDILVDASVVRTALIIELMASPIEARRERLSSRLFPSMDRLVHRSEGWTLTVAMNSRRTAWYECGNGENDLGAQTSSGMTYLYVDGDERHFADAYWPTCDLAAPAGTTVDNVPLRSKVEGEWGAGRPQNEWTGGVTLEGWALAGHHMIAPGGSGLAARKTWLAGPQHVTCLGSDISFRSLRQPVEPLSHSMESDLSAKTVVEHRSITQDRAVLTIDGEPMRDAFTARTSAWAHLTGIAGYVFLQPTQIEGSIQDRSGAWSRINRAGTDSTHTRHYATMNIWHPGDEIGAYGYLVLPCASVEDTKVAAMAPPVEVLANSAEVQAVSSGEVTAANFWRAGSVAGITVDRPASLLRRTSTDGVEVVVSDPTQVEDTLALEFAGGPFAGVAGERVQLEQRGSYARVTVDVSKLAGAQARFRLTYG